MSSNKRGNQKRFIPPQHRRRKVVSLQDVKAESDAVHKVEDSFVTEPIPAAITPGRYVHAEHSFVDVEDVLDYVRAFLVGTNPNDMRCGAIVLDDGGPDEGRLERPHTIVAFLGNGGNRANNAGLICGTFNSLQQYLSQQSEGQIVDPSVQLQPSVPPPPPREYKTIKVDVSCSGPQTQHETIEVEVPVDATEFEIMEECEAACRDWSSMWIETGWAVKEDGDD